MKLTEEEYKKKFKGPGRKKAYPLDDLDVMETHFIPCKKKEKDRRLNAARVSCANYSRNGKLFRVTAQETGLLIVRVS